MRYNTPKEISVVFHNGSNYDYHFMIKELVEEFEGQFECLGEKVSTKVDPKIASLVLGIGQPKTKH